MINGKRFREVKKQTERKWNGFVRECSENVYKNEAAGGKETGEYVMEVNKFIKVR